MLLCSIVIVISIIYSFIKDGGKNLTACVVLASVLYYVILVYQANKVVICLSHCIRVTSYNHKIQLINGA